MPVVPGLGGLRGSHGSTAGNTPEPRLPGEVQYVPFYSSFPGLGSPRPVLLAALDRFPDASGRCLFSLPILGCKYLRCAAVLAIMVTPTPVA